MRGSFARRMHMHIVFLTVKKRSKSHQPGTYLFSIVMIVMILNHAWKSSREEIYSVSLFTWRSISMKRISFTRNVYRTFTCHLSLMMTRKRNDTLLLVSISRPYSRAVFAVCDVRIEKYSWYYVRCQRRHCITSRFDVILIHQDGVFDVNKDNRRLSIIPIGYPL